MSKVFAGPALAAHLSPSPRRKSMAPLSPGSRDSPSMPSKGPSLVGIMASKRMARKFANRFAERRKTMEPGKPAKQLEPTYRMEPKVKFQPGQVESIMKKHIDERLSSFKYSPRLASMMTKILTEEIKEKIKELDYERYKIVCIITLGEKKNQGLRVTSRCTWDANLDNMSTYNFQNATTFCTATVYGVYHE